MVRDTLSATAATQPIEPAHQRSAATAVSDASVSQDCWLLTDWLRQMRGEAPQPFVVPLALVFEGTLDRLALGEALNDVVARHDTLRMTFPHAVRLNASEQRRLLNALRARDPLRTPAFQVTVHPTARLALDDIDQRTADPDIDDASLCTQQVERLVASWPLDRAPLVRAALIARSDDRHLLVLLFHHLVIDGWSLALFRAELEHCYRVRIGAADAALPPVAAPYVRFAASQREDLAGRAEVLSRQWRNVWEQYCALQPLRHEIAPAEWTAAPVAVRQTVTVDASTVMALRAACRAWRTTLVAAYFSALLIAWRVRTGRQIALWTMFANRTDPTFERTIGWFAQGRLLSPPYAPDQPIANLVSAVHGQLLSSDGQCLPIAVLAAFAAAAGIATVDPTRLHATFDHAYRDLDRPSLLPDVCVARVPVPYACSSATIRFLVAECGSGLSLSASFRHDLAPEACVRALLRGWHVALTGMADAPSSTLGEWSLAVAKEFDHDRHDC